MDPVKIGKFIAALRHRDGLTQQALGEKLGVTNKTVSRWETGCYMPDIAMFQALSALFHVSINELLSGRFLEAEEANAEADRNLVGIATDSAFSFQERTVFWRRKWLREHIGLMVLGVVLFLAYCVYAYVKRNTILLALSPLLSGGIYSYLRNQMFIYVESRLFGSENKA